MNGEEQCILCGNGLNCSFGNDDPQQLAGFWVDFDREKNILSVYRCRNELECPAGILGSCANGRASRACNNCKSWHKPDKNGTCDACVGVDSLPLLWFFLGTLVLSGLTWLFAQTSLARQRLGQVTVFLTAGQVIMLMQLMAALKNLDFQWTGASPVGVKTPSIHIPVGKKNNEELLLLTPNQTHHVFQLYFCQFLSQKYFGGLFWSQ